MISIILLSWQLRIFKLKIERGKSSKKFSIQFELFLWKYVRFVYHKVQSGNLSSWNQFLKKIGVYIWEAFLFIGSVKYVFSHLYANFAMACSFQFSIFAA